MKNLHQFLTLSAALIFAPLAVQPLHAFAPEFTPAIYTLVPADDPAYAAGTSAMNDHRWSDAVAAFDRVISSKSGNADAAIYWKAYSLNKLGKKSLALATCYQLRAQYKASSWNHDCSALSIDTRVNVRLDRPDLPEMPEAPEMPEMPEMSTRHGSDADLKLLALNSLLHQDPAKAVPILKGILAGNQPVELKKHAIFVLAQSKSPEAQSVLHEAVTGKIDPSLQLQAIQMMGVFEGKRGNDTLAEVYRNTSDMQVKRAVISAFFISQDAPRLVDLARNEKDLNLKRSIVSQLAIMNDKAASDYMLELLK
jgi:hypothetical protein